MCTCARLAPTFNLLSEVPTFATKETAFSSAERSDQQLGVSRRI